MPSTDEEQRRAVERWRGKKLADDQWSFGGPGPGEDIDITIRAWLPRIADYGEWEIAAEMGLARAGIGVASDPWIRGQAEIALQDLFGQGGRRASGDPPPYRSPMDGYNWLANIEQEAIDMCPLPQQGDQRQARAELQDHYWQSEAFFTDDERSDYRPQRCVWMPQETENQGAETRRHHGGPGAWFVLPGERCFLPLTRELRVLANGAYTISVGSRCWSLGQATCFILTGEVPQLPRVRLWASHMSGGAARAFIELNGVFSYREMQTAYRALRENAKATGKRSFKPSDQQIIDFWEGAGSRFTTIRERRNAWNAGHPERPFSNESAILKAYKRAKSRDGMA
ncbi:MAG: hypothetical protein ACR2JY_04260 [Chloroflexota bacterium]